MHRRLFLLCPALLACSKETPIDLTQHAWNHRVLLLFAPSPSHPTIDAQRRSFQNSVPNLLHNSSLAKEFRERHLVLYLLTPDAITFETPSQTTSFDASCLTPTRQHFRVDPKTPTILLLGKDTGVKLRTDPPLSPDKLFATIDAMPMRQREMQTSQRPDKT